MNCQETEIEMSCADEITKIVEEVRMNSLKVLNVIEEEGIFRINDIFIANQYMVMNESKVYLFSNGQKKDIPNELVKKFSESLLNVNMIDIDSRNDKNEIEIDFRFNYLDEVVKYMTNEYDINELNGIEFVAFCRELMEMNIPFKMDIMNRLWNGSNEHGVRWKNRSIVVNRNEYKLIYDYIKLRLSYIKYNDRDEKLEFMIDDKYESIIQCFSKFIEDGNIDYNSLIENVDRRRVNEFVNEGLIDMNNENVQSFFNPLYSPFLRNTILFGNEYDSYLREWTGDSYQWKLIYRASDHGYTASSFHENCDNVQGPTLIIIKSDGGWIFGGYTTQSWSGDSIFVSEFFIHR